MNKTNIISFIIDVSLLNLWNVSSSMRKRLKWMLKDKIVTIKEYNEKVFILTKWVNIGSYEIPIKKVEDIQPGVANYWIESQEQLDRIHYLNKEVRCVCINFSPVKPISISKVRKLQVNLNQIPKLAKYTITEVETIECIDMYEEKIKDVLSILTPTKGIILTDCSISGLDLSKYKIREVELENVTITGDLILPLRLENLKVSHCEGANYIKSAKISRLDFFLAYSREEEAFEFLYNIKSLKELQIEVEAHRRIEETIEALFSCLPCTTRRIYFHDVYEHSYPDRIKQVFPYFIGSNAKIPMKQLEESNLREINPGFEGNEGVLAARPRKIIVNSTCFGADKHPELFEKADQICLSNEEFKFDCLTNKVRKLKIYNCNKESKEISRFRA